MQDLLLAAPSIQMRAKYGPMSIHLYRNYLTSTAQEELYFKINGKISYNMLTL